MDDFVDVKVNQKSTVNILCKLKQIGEWVDLLEEKGFEVTYIGKVDPEKHQVSPDTWNVVGTRSWTIDERWGK